MMGWMESVDKVLVETEVKAGTTTNLGLWNGFRHSTYVTLKANTIPCPS